MAYQCTICGESHDELPALGFKCPDYADLVPIEERRERVKIDDDLCVVDNEYFFIRGSLIVPIIGQQEGLNFAVWVSQRTDHFMSYVENFDTDDIGPYFGWLGNEFNFHHQPTLNLETLARFQGNGLRPNIELKESEHPLSVAQREGVSLDQAWEIAHAYLG